MDAHRMETPEIEESLLLLTTQNRYDGRAETTLLAYGKDGDNFIIVAKNENEHYKPDWYLNLKEEPVVQLELNGTTFHAWASTPVGKDRLRIWDHVQALADHDNTILPRDTAIIVLNPMR